MLRLKVMVGDEDFVVEVPEFMIVEGQDYFDQLDDDMAKGYQMSRTWVDSPHLEQRCQIVADKLYSTLHSGNKKVGSLMAAYILSRLPQVKTVYINLEGDMNEHDFA